MDNFCVETGTLDVDWAQPEIKVPSKKSEEKSRAKVDELGLGLEESGLDWSRPLVEPAVKVKHKLGYTVL